MWTIKQAADLQALLQPVTARGGSFVYALRLTGTAPDAEDSLRQLLEKAQDTASLTVNRLTNPDGRALAELTAVTGPVSAVPEQGEMRRHLEGWLPGLRPKVLDDLAEALSGELTALRLSGKNDSVLRNAYVKLLCWLKNAALNALQRVGTGLAPKVILCGQAGTYELSWLWAVACAGCDALLLDTAGKPGSAGRLQTLELPGQRAFPPDFDPLRLMGQGKPASSAAPANTAVNRAPLGAPRPTPVRPAQTQQTHPQGGVRLQLGTRPGASPAGGGRQNAAPQQTQASQPAGGSNPAGGGSNFHFRISGMQTPPQETAQPAPASQPTGGSNFHFRMSGMQTPPQETAPSAPASQPAAGGSNFHFRMSGMQTPQETTQPVPASQPTGGGSNFHFRMSGMQTPPQETAPSAPAAQPTGGQSFHFQMGGSSRASQNTAPQPAAQPSGGASGGSGYHFQLHSPKQAETPAGTGGAAPDGRINLTRGSGRVGAVPAPQAPVRTQRGTAPAQGGILCTNAWLQQDDGLDAVTRLPEKRSDKPGLICNLLLRAVGCEDPSTYEGELLQMATRMRGQSRKVVPIDGGLEPPTQEEIAQVRRRGMYASPEQAVKELAGNLQAGASLELQRMLTAGFLEVMGMEARRPGVATGVLVNTAVHVICWFRRYQARLFSGWKRPQLACVFVAGGARNDKEALFYRLLARLPADVILLCPDGHVDCTEDPLLYELHYENRCSLDAFPKEGGHLTTTARRAEGVIQTLLHQDAGMYQDRQFSKAQSVILHSTAEEIDLYWRQELQYRPGFSTAGGTVTMPVLFAKVSGVSNPRKLLPYWQDIKRLMGKDTVTITSFPHIRRGDPNPVAPHATEFLAGGRLQRDRIRTHRCYQNGLLRQEMEELLLDKLQLMLDERLIAGTYQNGTEYTVVSVCLNLSKEIRRLIQEFTNFATRNPKLLGVFCGDEPPSQEDAILSLYLSMIGFDVVYYVPTGYQGIERWYTRPLLDEHQAGDYLYDLRVPDFSTITDGALRNIINNFKRRT
ncbi:MAG: hypothetical protein IKP40_06330 [Clostridia bacterium]|nr:hypothetical protein [Clostridia bacterium]